MKKKEIFYSEVETKVWFSSSFYLWNKIPSFIKNIDKTLFFPTAFTYKKLIM